MESPQYPSAATPSTLDTPHPVSTTTTTATTSTESSFGLQAFLPAPSATPARSTPSTPPVSPASRLAKLPSLAPQPKLTGEAALLLSRHRAQSPTTTNNERSVMANDSGPKPATADSLDSPPNPAAILATYTTTTATTTTATSMSRPLDPPPLLETSSPTTQKVLGSIASAANALDTSSTSPVTSASSNGSSAAADLRSQMVAIETSSGRCASLFSWRSGAVRLSNRKGNVEGQSGCSRCRWQVSGNADCVPFRPADCLWKAR